MVGLYAERYIARIVLTGWAAGWRAEMVILQDVM
jgi:hypothetical protein